MKTCSIRKWPFFALFLGLFFISSAGFSQINIGVVDAGPFTPGSTIAVPFSIANSCAGQGNVFQLYLSDQNGNFGTERLIGSYNGFYSTYVNGLIPTTGILPGTGYKVRVKTTVPASVSSESAAFEIRLGFPVEAKLTSTYLNSSNTETFGTCVSKPNNSFFINNESTPAATIAATVKNEATGGTTTLNFAANIASFTADQTHYTIIAKATFPDGSIGTKGYLLVNNRAITAFGTSGNNIVCLPLGFLEFNVDYTSPAGIQNNFPGNSYTISWGDGSMTAYTLCDIINNAGKVTHPYTISSCGRTSVTSAGTIYNAFPVTINVSNDFCGTVGTPVSSSAKVVVKPMNDFTFQTPSCTNTDVTFFNTSVLGEDPNTNTPACAPNQVTYNWFVDGVITQANKPRSYNLVTRFLTRGEHVIRLESNSSGACNAEPVEKKICIQDPPKPAFSLPQTTICVGSTLAATDLSILDNTCESANTYSWSVSPAVTYANGTSASSTAPAFVFTNPGIYTIVLNITTPSCGLVASGPQTVVVNEPPAATLSPDIILCNLATYDFNPTTAGPTRTLISGTYQDLADTYTWTVTPSGSGTYSFTGGTSASSKYPSIKFDSYDAYSVTVTHKNNCGTIQKTQKLTFTTAPIINAGIDQNLCFTESSFNLAGTITGAVISQAWVGGDGEFFPSRNDLNATYTPTAAEKANGTVTLILRATTNLAPPCDQIPDEIILTIYPDISVTSAASKSICTGKNVDYTPTGLASGTVFNWTATGSANVTGVTPSGSGGINDLLVNTDLNANGTVTYTITPQRDGCNGVPFNFVVTVTPNPNVVATALNLTICNNTSSAITFTSAAANVNYTYTSAVTGTVTGNRDRTVATAAAQINDVLINTGTASGTVTYTVTPVSAGGCIGAATSITITVLPSATLANAGPDESICNAATYSLKGNVPDVGTGKWTVVPANTTITFDDDTKNNAVVSGLVAGNSYTFRWTISDQSCSSNSDDVVITVNPLSVGGTTGNDLTLCAGANNGTISLTGQVGSIVRWEISIDNGVTWASTNSTANPYVFSNITVTTKFRAIVQSGVCSEAQSSATTITINPSTVASNAGANQSLCSGNGVTLNGNNPAPNSGLWTLVSGQSNITISDPTLFNTAVSGLIPGQTYRFRWTITGFEGCPPSSSETTVTYFFPVTNSISTPADPICFGQSATITGSTPTGGSGVFSYQWQSSADGNTWTNLTNATNKDLTVNVSVSTFYRRLVNSTICIAMSNSVQVVVLPALSNNTIAADQIICIGNAAAPLIGSAPTGGNGAYGYQWQSSLNATVWTDVTGATGADYTPPVPTATIYYRRSVASGSCPVNISNQVKITVNLPAKAEFTYATDAGCVPFNLSSVNLTATPYPDRNATYTWFANNVQIGTGIDFPGYTITAQNQSVVIKLVVTSSLGCNGDEFSHTFFTRQDVTASYTQDVVEGCGPLSVRFTNTSTSLTDATFRWDFGNGTSSNLAEPSNIVYAADLTGRDITYTVTLEATTPCGVSRQTSTVLVKAAPISIFSPDKTAGCSPFTVTFSNTSPGNNGTYTYDFGDGTTLTKTDKSSVSHTYNTIVVTNYIVKMIAVNECGTNESSYTINVAPNNITAELVVNSSQLRGCAPFSVDFFNNTTGANTFVYDFGDGSTVVRNISPETVSHTFTRAGRYRVTLYASNDCSNASTTEEIEVLEQPEVSFTADKTSGCDGLVVKFKNNSRNAIGYIWDFGDGTTSTASEPTHTFNGVGRNFTVSLTATNTLGCTNTITASAPISVVAPPVATFTVSPGNELSVPNYAFGFRDSSTGAVSWEWTFGDGAVSTLQNPNHTYGNEGTYTVTLKVLNREGCSATTVQSVRIIGVPGYLNVPNSFMPASAKNEIRVFKAKGRGIQEWKMSVFNKWGQMLWESSKLDDGAPLEGWDGTYNGKEQPQGVYYWKIEVKFVNGSDWKGMTYDSSSPRKTGVIYLIR
ncbi:PKD domain-containing protein [Pedobacter petrophilus]|uniref:PKD domain-containing protein n=1 Tax=Pedobacter petrophilus TaxID=1908241 RepID=A0A7K0G400_9SPHI|nr:PKD domain-containing protein [Pedobacter petrophilus]MRX77706.1 PKD domain-containing protein [Pedobacter petrophilus]